MDKKALNKKASSTVRISKKMVLKGERLISANYQFLNQNYRSIY